MYRKHIKKNYIIHLNQKNYIIHLNQKNYIMHLKIKLTNTHTHTMKHVLNLQPIQRQTPSPPKKTFFFIVIDILLYFIRHKRSH